MQLSFTSWLPPAPLRDTWNNFGLRGSNLQSVYFSENCIWHTTLSERIKHRPDTPYTSSFTPSLNSKWVAEISPYINLSVMASYESLSLLASTIPAPIIATPSTLFSFFFLQQQKKRKTKKQAKRHHMDSNVMFAHSDAEQKLSRMTKAVRWLTDAANTWAFCLPFHIHSRTSSHTAKVNMFWLKRGNKNKGFCTRLLVCAEFNRNDGDKMLFPCALALGTKLCLHRSFLHTDQLLFPFSRNPLQAGDHFKQSMHTQLSWS